MKSQLIRQPENTRWGMPNDRRQSGCPLPLSFPWWRFVFMAVMMIYTSLAFAATNDLATALQKGLFEEEANHNYPAAIEAYQGVINRFDEDRKLAATAIFRVGEIYRKQGKTNEANAQYERVVRDFADQSALATLSQSYLAAATALSVNTPTTNANGELALTSDEAEEVRKIRAMIRDSPDLINATDNGGSTRLHTAAWAGQVVVARFLIENGANVNGQNREGSTPLHRAAVAGHKALVELLLAHGAKVELTDSYGSTPLHAAARLGFRSIIEVLLSHGADVEAKNRWGSTPLHLAVANGFKSIAELLLSHHADVNSVTSDARDEQGRIFNGTPLHIAASRDDQPIAEMLLANKANPNATNSTGDTPLHIAASRGNEKLIELFLANKANVDTTNKKGETPLDLAVTPGYTNAVEVLLAHAADVNARNPVETQYNGWTPLLYAASARKPETVALLLKRGADPNAGTGPYGPNWTRGTTALLMASISGESEIVEALLNSNANPNAEDAKELSPTFAAMRGQEAEKRKYIIMLLLQHGADIEAEGEQGKTLLMLACERKDKLIVDFLLSHKANVNARNPNGLTALHFAVFSLFDGSNLEVGREIVETILAAGANVNVQSNDGKTPLTYLLNPGRTIPPNLGPTRAKVELLLRGHGAVTDLPRLDVIEVRRPDANFSRVIFTKGTNGWDQFTLFDLIGAQYKLLSALANGESRSDVAVYNFYPPGTGLDFPDFKHVRIRHPAPNLKDWSERVVDISPAFTNGDCSVDIPLELGDQVEISEADHVLNAKWEGLSTNELYILKKCLTRQVSVVVKGQTKSISLAPAIDAHKGYVGYDVYGQMTLQVDMKTVAPFMIKPALAESKLLLASSDLSRIKLIRTDAAGQKRELIVDCSYDKPAPSVWLRGGDVIEVPDKP